MIPFDTPDHSERPALKGATTAPGVRWPGSGGATFEPADVVGLEGAAVVAVLGGVLVVGGLTGSSAAESWDRLSFPTDVVGASSTTVAATSPAERTTATRAVTATVAARVDCQWTETTPPLSASGRPALSPERYGGPW